MGGDWKERKRRRGRRMGKRGGEMGGGGGGMERGGGGMGKGGGGRVEFHRHLSILFSCPPLASS